MRRDYGWAASAAMRRPASRADVGQGDACAERPERQTALPANG